MSWSFRTADPGALTVLGLLAMTYALGMRRGRGQARRPPGRWWFAGALLAGAVALATPLDTRQSLTAHMVQHVILLAVAAPLLAIADPLPVLAAAAPPGPRRTALAAGRRARRAVDRHSASAVAGSLVTAAAAMWAWHVPLLYDAAEGNAGLHAAEHATFLLSATAAWWVVAHVRRSRRGAAALGALFGSVPGIVLGSAMVLSPRPWYPLYVHGGDAAAALRDQQVAGVVMWAFGGMAAVIAGAALFASWLRFPERAEGWQTA